jgi:alcohol dehydrogenase, propanol-preferring
MLTHLFRRHAQVETAPLQLVSLPELAPGPGQVRLRVSVCAACRTDLHVVEGELALHTLLIVPGPIKSSDISLRSVRGPHA